MSDQAMTRIETEQEATERLARASQRRTAACGKADFALRVLWAAISDHKRGDPRIDGNEDHLMGVIREARGDLAEWCPESP